MYYINKLIFEEEENSSVSNEEMKEVISELKNHTSKCEICHREFDQNTPVKYAKHLVFPADKKRIIIVCQNCNYRMYLNEQENIRRLTDAVNETFDKLGGVMKDFCQMRDDIVSDIIVDTVDTYPVPKRPMMDLLYKYPNWYLDTNEMDEESLQERRDIKGKYMLFVELAKLTKVWNGNRVDGITSKKIQDLKNSQK